MRLYNLLWIVTWFSLFLYSKGLAQCSDAGVCAIGYSLPEQQIQHTIEILYRYGNSGKEDKIAYNNVELKANLNIFSHTSLRISFPLYRWIKQSDSNVNGIGDLIGIIGQDIKDVFGHDLTAIVGMRLATGNDNADPALPQAYQPGLGTNDLIFGLKLAGKNHTISAGYQIVENTFTKNTLTPIRRGDDLYLQFAYLIHTGDLNIRGDIQVIQRLTKTERKNADGSISTLDKTDQMQMNLGVEFEYAIDNIHHLTAGFIFPVLKRETNIDGLTRVFTFFAGYRLGF